jgi:ferric-dicitrate binding protein FerR (iron transport regulator)
MSEIDPIILKYLQGISTFEENEVLHQWTEQSSENKKRLYDEKDIWETSAFLADQKTYDVSSELGILRKKLNSDKKRPVAIFRKIVEIAAVLLITFGLGWASQFITFSGDQQSIEVSQQEIFVPKGQVNQIFLADGTRIWVNSETRLSVPSVFSSTERVVKLSGEAFFEVAKDKNRPFKVEVNGEVIEVLGTTFNVRAYNNSNEIETTLESGQIRLHTSNKITILNTGDQCVLNKTTNLLKVDKVDPINFSSWKNGRYEFQNKDLIEVFKVIERWYDVEITVDETYFKGMHFSGVIKRNKDAKHFLELLNHSIPINYEVNLDKIEITHK